jgi:gluconolactonase
MLRPIPIALRVVPLVVFAACAGSPPNPGPLDDVSALERVASGFRFTEGPVYDRLRQRLLFSDIAGDTIYAVGVDGRASVYRSPSGRSNGLVVDDEGRLWAAEHQTRRVSRTELDGRVTTVVDAFDGKRLNSPNDLALGHEGSLFFTDPPFGLEGAASEQDGCHVYRLSPLGEMSIVWRGSPASRPNGVAMSPSRRTLYVAFTNERVVRRAGVGGYGVPTELEAFAVTSSEPDGMTVDIRGNVFVATGAGIEVFDRLGTPLGTIPVPERATNCAFGGEDMQWLYVTAGTSVYRCRTSVRGVR